MHVVVIGAGIIGVTTAYWLRQAGCEVTVVERNSGVAQEASFANGGVISPGYTGPLAAPGMPRALMKALINRDATLRLRPSLDRTLWRWLRRFVAESTLERWRINKLRIQRLALYSRDELHALQARHGIDYEQQPGLLQLYRTERELERGEPLRTLLKEQGVAHRLLSAAEARAVECALSEQTQLAGALHLPDDETGNCAYFARRLRELAEADGVRFRFNAALTGLELAAGRLEGLAGLNDLGRFDGCVLAAGADSASLLAGTGIAVPLLPVRGASATVNILRHELAPLTSVLDDRYKVAVTRMGRRLRIAGTSTLGDRRSGTDLAAIETLLKVARDWYPGAAAYSQAQPWAGLRLALPDGPPLLGATPVRGLYLNIGHGSSGWALACGSARVVADIVTGRQPAIDTDGLTLERYGLASEAWRRSALAAS
jgi:D-amino-acid dehydrogenase